MRKLILLCTLLLALPALTRAQDADKTAEQSKPAEPAKAAPHFYHLVFQVQELDAAGKPANSRTFTTSVSTERGFRGSLRTGSRIPVATGASSDEKAGSSTVTQFQYIDIGVKFDISDVSTAGSKLAMHLDMEISRIADALDARTLQPVIRQNRGTAQALLPLAKPTIVFSSDSLDSKGSLQVVVTATPLE